MDEWCKNPVKASVKYGHISKWNTSMVTNMKELFSHPRKFNDDISKWNVRSVTNMSAMFYDSSFNGDISGWDVSSVTTMSAMFHITPFNGDISGWQISDSCDTNNMFIYCSTIREEHKPTQHNTTQQCTVKLKELEVISKI